MAVHPDTIDRINYHDSFAYWLNAYTHGVEPTTKIDGDDIDAAYDSGEPPCQAAKDWLEKHHPELLGTTPTPN